MGRDARVLNPVSIRWQRTAYVARCHCGTTMHPRLSEAETWALTHACEHPPNSFDAVVFDVFADTTVDTRNPPKVTTWHVAASGPAGHIGWDTTDRPPAKDTHITVTIEEHP